MRLLIKGKERGNPKLLFEETYDWPCVPRVGDEFVIPEREDTEGNVIPETHSTVERVWWIPEEWGCNTVTIRVDVKM